MRIPERANTFKIDALKLFCSAFKVSSLEFKIAKVIGQLKQQCEEVSGRFELENRLWKEERDQTTQTIRGLNSRIAEVPIYDTPPHEFLWTRARGIRPAIGSAKSFPVSRMANKHIYVLFTENKLDNGNALAVSTSGYFN
jgi:hypothetical protein